MDSPEITSLEAETVSVELIVSDTPDEDDEESIGYALSPNAPWRELAMYVTPDVYPALAKLAGNDYPQVGETLVDLAKAKADEAMPGDAKAVVNLIFGLIEDIDDDAYLRVD
jgi:hypothetical protein